jgi:cbb3-type cytochrome oxidase subunit 3
METLHTFFTLGAFASFMAVVWWAYAPARKDMWRECGELDDE